MSYMQHRSGLVSYPRLERLDLTQSQLNSFKFTPVDQSYERPVTFLESNWADPSWRPISTHPPLTQQASPSLTTVPSRWSERVQSHQPGATLTEGHLDDVRLRHGPAALRAAVDSGPVSPSKRSQHSLDNNHLNAQTFVPGRYQHATGKSVSSSNVPISRSIGEREDGISSLIRALSSEQEAHAATKAELQEERQRSVAHNDEVRRLTDHVRSLMGTINMLKSLVQHNMKKEQERDTQPLGHIVADLNSLAPASATMQTQSCAEPVANMNTTSLRTEGEKHNVAKTSSGNITRTNTRQHRSGPLVAVSERKSSQSWTRVKRKQDPDELIEWSSEDMPEEKNYDLSNDETGNQDINNVLESTNRVAMGVPTYEMTYESVSSHASGPGADEHTNQETSSTTAPLPEPCGEQLEPESAERQDSESLTQDVATMAMPYDPMIRWNVTARNPVFETFAEKYQHLGPGYTAQNASNSFWEYPVRYTPSQGQPNLYRTVMIDFIPPEAEYADLLSVILGGALESIQMYGPLANIANFKTARLVFNYERGAQTVYRRGQHPGIFVRGQQVRVWQVLQPTYPKNKQLEEDVFEHNYTRVIIMEGAHGEKIDLLPEKLAFFVQANFLIQITRKQGGRYCCIEFTDVESAVKAMRQLMRDRDFRGVHFDYEEDPCDGPYPASLEACS